MRLAQSALLRAAELTAVGVSDAGPDCALGVKRWQRFLFCTPIRFGNTLPAGFSQRFRMLRAISVPRNFAVVTADCAPRFANQRPPPTAGPKRPRGRGELGQTARLPDLGEFNCVLDTHQIGIGLPRGAEAPEDRARPPVGGMFAREQDWLRQQPRRELLADQLIPLLCGELQVVRSGVDDKSGARLLADSGLHAHEAAPPPLGPACDPGAASHTR